MNLERSDKIYLGDNLINTQCTEIDGKFIEIDNEKYYQIRNYHEMPDFFISIVSDSDHWMFISSNGSLTAGRKDRDNALFPYYTVDKIHDYKNITGSKSYFLVHKDNKILLWEPFTYEASDTYNITRNLYKNFYGNKIIFEEINHDLGLLFRYGWYNSERYGFIKKSTLSNIGEDNLKVDVLDGIRNILPSGVDYSFQNEYSNLLDAYKKSECLQKSKLGLFLLSSIPVDRAEPSESLQATTVWSCVSEPAYKVLISDKQVKKFRNGFEVEPEYDIKASRGAYFINSKLDLEKKQSNYWYIIADLNKDSSDVYNLDSLIRTKKDLVHSVIDDIDRGTENLKKKVSCADGFQITNSKMCYARHYSNTLYNIMRGGVFADSYMVNADDFREYVRQINKIVSKEYLEWLNNLPDKISYSDLVKKTEAVGDKDLIRITMEYLPLTFSRRHGDPSRPWNVFSIETKNEDGSVKYNYEGNWRDIFQNWEGLCYSFPEFIEGIICKFLNASTADGYNPYRIMRKGLDWEAPDPNDPWAYIGYWGDHQIIYLQKFLELSDKFHPGKLDELMISDIFTYANVPYQIKSYNEIVKDPKNTVIFHYDLNKKIRDDEKNLGADACLVKDKDNKYAYKVNLTEKILVSILSKLSNFIPEAGIWLNTQRPEWNDANNALVGNGTSMVTLYYLRRSLIFWKNKLEKLSIKDISISEEVAELFKTMYHFYSDKTELLNVGFSDSDRRCFADHLGQAHSKYRRKIYEDSFLGDRTEIKVKDLLGFTVLCLKYIDHSIKTNKRDDGLYHAYNLISIYSESISIRPLYEMLEGQVAVLSSGLLNAEENLSVLNALKNSKMFREDQYSYMLYPDRQLPRFIEKNVIPAELVEKSSLLKKLIKNHNTTIIIRDEGGNYHFNAKFRNAAILEEALNDLQQGKYSHLVESEKDKILEIYENVFDHKSFTGRSGTFFGYEGLGSIYWHMVSKLLLSVVECHYRATEEDADKSVIGQFKDHYYEIKAGIGLYKSPDLYGAFPMDAYSHTPGNAGVKQPGLTGQVKEDFISRLIELGIQIQNGEIIFNTSMLNHYELLDHEEMFEYYSITGNTQKIKLQKGQLTFTFCQVPVIYKSSDEDKISVKYLDGAHDIIYGNVLDKELSSLIFKRISEIEQIDVNVNFNK
jgi:hypothetical protein